MPERVLKLYPPPALEIVAEEIYQHLDIPSVGVPDRPYVMINMVSSVDGKATADGRAFRLGSEVDRRTMRNLRARADAVMIGAATLRAEKLSLGLDETASSPQPLAVIITNTGDVPLESNLIKPERQRVLVLVPRDLPQKAVSRLRCQAGGVIRVASTPGGPVDLEAALRILKAEHRVNLLLVEGGPTLNHALISRHLADELFLTLAPKLLGGTTGAAITILDGHPLPPQTQRLELLSLHSASDELFLRYGLQPRRTDTA